MNKFMNAFLISCEFYISCPLYTFLFNGTTDRFTRGTRAVAYSVRHYATSREVAGSSPDKVDFFNWPNPSSRTMAHG
jgi:hypothetical protein